MPRSAAHSSKGCKIDGLLWRASSNGYVSLNGCPSSNGGRNWKILTRSRSIIYSFSFKIPFFATFCEPWCVAPTADGTGNFNGKYYKSPTPLSGRGGLLGNRPKWRVSLNLGRFFKESNRASSS
ncbi:MAG: hypothetical protein Q4D38_09900 [Planctomycetia bacterium]|nr:hypothetical protein [Planctomycetia bacterium]